MSTDGRAATSTSSPTTETSKARASSANGIEGAAAREVEPRVMPVAGDQAAFDGAAVEREAHVRAAVLDREDVVAVREHDDGERPDLREQLAPLAELGDRSGADAHGNHLSSLVHPGSLVHLARSFRKLSLSILCRSRNEFVKGSLSKRARFPA